MGYSGGLDECRTHCLPTDVGHLGGKEEANGDFGDVVSLLLEEAEEAVEGGGDDFLVDLGAERKALILTDVGSAAAAAARSYSSMRLARSSSDVIETNASKSSDGNWHLRFTEVPHISPNLTSNSIKQKINELIIN